MQSVNDLFGERLEIANVVVGNNLNLPVVRGFARLDVLAHISQPDVYNQVTNELGTQRDPDNRHALDALDYAMASVSADPLESPHAFTEVILNARDTNVVSVQVAGVTISLNDATNPVSGPMVGELLIETKSLDESRSKDPQISRVDGNHRLLKVKERIAKAIEAEEEIEFPTVPFAMFIGLTADQERSLFKDINGEQRSMNTSHLAQIRHRLEGDKLLEDDKKGGPSLWIAERLQEPGFAFHNKVFKGGAKKIFKELGMPTPPISINTLKGAVAKTLSSSDELVAITVSDNNQSALENLVATYVLRASVIDMYWKAVANAYPEGWQDTKNYIVLQSIGLNSLSKLAGRVIDTAILEQSVDQNYFNQVMNHIATKVSMEKKDYEGVAGEAGTARVLRDLLDARTNGFEIAQVIASLKVEVASPLDTSQ